MSEHEYGQRGGELFEAARRKNHGRELLNRRLALCLSPAIVRGMNVVDLGCGAGSVGIEIARNGAAYVLCQDIQKQMIERCEAAAALESAEVRGRLKFECSDACELHGIASAQFDIVISINVGCNMPCKALKRHLLEMRRILRPGKRGIFTFPDNLNVMFTDGRRPVPEAAADVRSRLLAVHAGTLEQLQEAIGGLSEILFGTFVHDGCRFRLVDDGHEEFAAGTPIFRKIPGLAVPNYWHTFPEYRGVIQSAGFCIEAVHRDKFESEDALVQHNSAEAGSTLGLSYLKHNFTVLELAAV